MTITSLIGTSPLGPNHRVNKTQNVLMLGSSNVFGPHILKDTNLMGHENQGTTHYKGKNLETPYTFKNVNNGVG